MQACGETVRHKVREERKKEREPVRNRKQENNACVSEIYFFFSFLSSE